VFVRTGPAVANRAVDDHGLVLTVRTERAVAERTRPGQFFMIRRPGPSFPLLSRPFSIFDADPESGDLSFLYEVVGLGTALLRDVRPGDPVTLVGPLGNAFVPDASAERHFLVAGGVGIAPFLYLARCIGSESRGGVTVLFGARTSSHLLGISEFERAGVRVEVATDDGSRGHRGTSVDLLRETIRAAGDGARLGLYACGPNAMLRAVKDLVSPARKCQISLEARMACGFGACVGCAFPVSAPTAEGHRFALVCKEGTVFEAGSVLFEKAGT